ncbi:MAG TPA: S9 family peptidase, partial [Candidatus Eisenbacteria bacterium]|nr:S9 family peptidase [Candidatus Eisenbacteria bacterium]
MTAVVEEYHGVRVADPFRWLEQVSEPPVQAWVMEQGEKTAEHLRGLPGRASIERRLRRLWDYQRQSVPVRRGNRHFFFRNTGLQNQPVLFVQDASSTEPRVLLDPNSWSPEGTV